jgi:ubiquinone/menaquinone biosynthesis C-methylase UbiE
MIDLLRRALNPLKYVSVGLTNASDRDRWVESVLLSLPAGLKLLDAGAGECQYKRYCDHLHYVSQDFSKYNGTGNNVALQMRKWDTSLIDIVSDIVNIPVTDGEFDVILCTEVLEHLPDPILAIREFSRILKDDGMLIITAPFVSFTHFAPYHYSTGFNRYYYLYHLPKLGFNNVEISENGNYFEFLAQEVRRIGSMSERYCGKPIGFFHKLLIRITLAALARMSTADRGSKEVANYGLHVTARKK